MTMIMMVKVIWVVKITMMHLVTMVSDQRESNAMLPLKLSVEPCLG